MNTLDKLWEEIEEKHRQRKQERINKGCIVIERPSSCEQKGGCACYALDGWICKDRLGEKYSEEPISAVKNLMQQNLFGE